MDGILVLSTNLCLGLNTLRTGDANLRFCITTVKNGRHKIAFQHGLSFYTLNYTIHGAFLKMVLRAGFLKNATLL
jgi:hypothetical protein